MSFYPVLMFDNYNPHASALDEMKAGAYFSSYDVVGKYDIFGGVTFNKLLERDIFFQFDYNDKIPLLSSLGIYPQFTLSVYNLSRQTNESIGLGLDTVNTPVDLALTEVNAAFSGPLFLSSLDLSLGFTFDRYSATVSGFVEPTSRVLYGSTGWAYFLGKTLYSQLDFDGILPIRKFVDKSAWDPYHFHFVCGNE